MISEVTQLVLLDRWVDWQMVGYAGMIIGLTIMLDT